MWGPWRITWFLGVANNIFAVIFAVVALFFIFWPLERPVTAENMNYNCMITGVVIMAAILYYVL